VNKKLYVGNLNYQTTQSQLEALFAEAGEVVEAVVVEDRYTGRSRGFGFVEMATEEAAAAAIEKFHGQTLDGRTLNVAEARPPRRREERSYDNRW
jgi:RNA recognition motif-containing protein